MEQPLVIHGTHGQPGQAPGQVGTQPLAEAENRNSSNDIVEIYNIL